MEGWKATWMVLEGCSLFYTPKTSIATVEREVIFPLVRTILHALPSQKACPPVMATTVGP